jgi:hypothetical protein
MRTTGVTLSLDSNDLQDRAHNDIISALMSIHSPHGLVIKVVLPGELQYLQHGLPLKVTLADEDGDLEFVLNIDPGLGLLLSLRKPVFEGLRLIREMYNDLSIGIRILAFLIIGLWRQSVSRAKLRNEFFRRDNRVRRQRQTRLAIRS